MTKTAITQIHEAARLAPVGSLDTPAYLDVDIGINRFIGGGADNVYVDVPVGAIIALGRRDFLEAGDTWRSATHRLVGKDWGANVFDYFTNPLEEETFPASGSRFELRLSTIGGLCSCGNGNHRLVAGKTWLTNKYGEKAYFKLVKVRYQPLDVQLAAFLAASAVRGTSIRTARVNQDLWTSEAVPLNLLLQREDDPSRLFAHTAGGVVELPDRRSWLRKFTSPIFEQYGGYDVVTTPGDAVNAMLNDTWIRPQLLNPKRW